MVLESIFVVAKSVNVITVDGVSVTDDSRELVVGHDERQGATDGIRDVGLKARLYSCSPCDCCTLAA